MNFSYFLFLFCAICRMESVPSNSSRPNDKIKSEWTAVSDSHPPVCSIVYSQPFSKKLMRGSGRGGIGVPILSGLDGRPPQPQSSLSGLDERLFPQPQPPSSGLGGRLFPQPQPPSSGLGGRLFPQPFPLLLPFPQPQPLLPAVL